MLSVKRSLELREFLLPPRAREGTTERRVTRIYTSRKHAPLLNTRPTIFLLSRYYMDFVHDEQLYVKVVERTIGTGYTTVSQCF